MRGGGGVNNPFDDSDYILATGDTPIHVYDFDDELSLQQTSATAATPTEFYTAATPTDITDDFECGNFLTAVREMINRPTGPIYDIDVAGITELGVSNRNITSLAGIEHFTALFQLSVSGNQLTELDISNNTELSLFFANNNQLTDLDVSNNTELSLFFANNNQLTELDVSANTALWMLDVSNNQLTELDLSANTALSELWVGDNQLATLDLSNNTALWMLDARNNQLTELDLSANTALGRLYANNNQLTELDLSNNTALRDLNVDNNLLTELDVSNNTALEGFQAHWNLLTELDVSNNTALSWLGVNNNQLTELDIPVPSGWRRLVTLDVRNNFMTDPDDVRGWRDNNLRLLPEDEEFYFCSCCGFPLSDGFHFFPQRERPNPTLTLSTGRAGPGETLNIQLRIDNNPGFAGMSMRLSFSDELTLVGHRFGGRDTTQERIEDLRLGFTAPTPGNNDSFMGWAGRQTNITDDGVLLKLTFTVCRYAVPYQGFHTVEVFFENDIDGVEVPTNAADEPLDIDITNGGVTVRSYLLGDANGDGRRTSADGTRLARHLAGHGVTIDLRGMDLNLDDYVDGADLVWLAQWLMGHGIPPAVAAQ